MPFQYLNSVRYIQVEPEFMREEMAGRVGFEIAPIRDITASRVRWRVEDNFRGMQNMRGMNGEPISIKLPGSNLYEYEPGVYGEFTKVDEKELTERSANLDIQTDNIDVADLVSQHDRVLIGRELDRQEWAIWQMLGTGTITVYMPGEEGIIKGWTATFTIQTATATIPWATVATAVPTQNFQAIQLTGNYAGRSVNFGAAATAYMNSYTANLLLNNTNTSDLYGKRGANGSTLNTIENVRQFLIGQNLPRIQVYDNGWIDDYNHYQKFIPDNRVIVVGARPNNVKVANYFRTRNVHNNNRSANSYRFVKNSFDGINAPKQVPGDLQVHRGHNGGPGIMYPSAVYVLSV